MQHDEITRTITGSSPEDWVILGEGPLFLDRLSGVSGPEGHWLEADSHNHLAVYQPDVDLRLAWGLTTDTDLIYDGWVFSDQSIERVLVDGFWRGALVARRTVLAVDGYRSYLPDAERTYVKAGESPRDFMTVGWTARKSEVALARLLQELLQRPAGEFDNYMTQTGIAEVPDE
jgi:hypothetical protein